MYIVDCEKWTYFCNLTSQTYFVKCLIFQGQLGLGASVKFSCKPTEIKDGLAEENIVNISVGENTSAAVTGNFHLGMWKTNAPFSLF